MSRELDTGALQLARTAQTPNQQQDGVKNIPGFISAVSQVIITVTEFKN
jgi:hypothetical protein